MALKISSRTWVASASIFVALLFFMSTLGPVVLLLTIAALAITLISFPVLLLTGRRKRAVQVLIAWGIYLPAYVVISTGMMLAGAVNEPSIPIGREICADSGCFAVDRIATNATSSPTVYMIFWHLSSNDNRMTKRFPGKGLELYMFDERGRKFALPDGDDPDPLDIAIPPGETVRQVMTFFIPADVQELYLTAKYRPFTYQSMLPGELSLLPHPAGKRIRIL